VKKDVRRKSTIDTALGVGGFPRGRIMEVFGPESSGKTTLTLT
jgi:recombination protein RecA